MMRDRPKRKRSASPPHAPYPPPQYPQAVNPQATQSTLPAQSGPHPQHYGRRGIRWQQPLMPYPPTPQPPLMPPGMQMAMQPGTHTQNQSMPMPSNQPFGMLNPQGMQNTAYNGYDPLLPYQEFNCPHNNTPQHHSLPGYMAYQNNALLGQGMMQQFYSLQSNYSQGQQVNSTPGHQFNSPFFPYNQQGSGHLNQQSINQMLSQSGGHQHSTNQMPNGGGTMGSVCFGLGINLPSQSQQRFGSQTGMPGHDQNALSQDNAYSPLQTSPRGLSQQTSQGQLQQVPPESKGQEARRRIRQEWQESRPLSTSQFQEAQNAHVMKLQQKFPKVERGQTREEQEAWAEASREAYQNQWARETQETQEAQKAREAGYDQQIQEFHHPLYQPRQANAQHTNAQHINAHQQLKDTFLDLQKLHMQDRYGLVAGDQIQRLQMQLQQNPQQETEHSTDPGLAHNPTHSRNDSGSTTNAFNLHDTGRWGSDNPFSSPHTAHTVDSSPPAPNQSADNNHSSPANNISTLSNQQRSHDAYYIHPGHDNSATISPHEHISLNYPSNQGQFQDFEEMPSNLYNGAPESTLQNSTSKTLEEHNNSATISPPEHISLFNNPSNPLFNNPSNQGQFQNFEMPILEGYTGNHDPPFDSVTMEELEAINASLNEYPEQQDPLPNINKESSPPEPESNNSSPTDEDLQKTLNDTERLLNNQENALKSEELRREGERICQNRPQQAQLATSLPADEEIQKTLDDIERLEQHGEILNHDSSRAIRQNRLRQAQLVAEREKNSAPQNGPEVDSYSDPNSSRNRSANPAFAIGWNGSVDVLHENVLPMDEDSKREEMGSERKRIPRNSRLPQPLLAAEKERNLAPRTGPGVNPHFDQNPFRNRSANPAFAIGWNGSVDVLYENILPRDEEIENTPNDIERLEQQHRENLKNQENPIHQNRLRQAQLAAERERNPAFQTGPAVNPNFVYLEPLRQERLRFEAQQAQQAQLAAQRNSAPQTGPEVNPSFDPNFSMMNNANANENDNANENETVNGNGNGNGNTWGYRSFEGIFDPNNPEFRFLGGPGDEGNMGNEE